MPIEVFSLEQFEQALPRHKKTNLPLCQHLGVIDGEHCYLMATTTAGVFVMIRSSVKRNGVSAELGEDSIRAWLCDEHSKPLGAKLQKHITREPGWNVRLTKMLRTLYGRALKIEACRCCNRPTGLYKTKQGPNAGRFFLKCIPCDNFVGFVELEEKAKVKAKV